MNTLQFGSAERRGLQQGADRTPQAQLGAGKDHPTDSNEIEFALQAYLDYQAYMPDPVVLRETPAAKVFLEICRALDKTRLH